MSSDRWVVREGLVRGEGRYWSTAHVWSSSLEPWVMPRRKAYELAGDCDARPVKLRPKAKPKHPLAGWYAVTGTRSETFAMFPTQYDATTYAAINRLSADCRIVELGDDGNPVNS